MNGGGGEHRALEVPFLMPACYNNSVMLSCDKMSAACEAFIEEVVLG